MKGILTRAFLSHNIYKLTLTYKNILLNIIRSYQDIGIHQQTHTIYDKEYRYLLWQIYEFHSTNTTYLHPHNVLQATNHMLPHMFVYH